jgi:hypothetical protein
LEVARPQPCLTATCVATIRPQSEPFSFLRAFKFVHRLWKQ